MADPTLASAWFGGTSRSWSFMRRVAKLELRDQNKTSTINSEPKAATSPSLPQLV
jgi:hypothetical protein